MPVGMDLAAQDMFYNDPPSGLTGMEDKSFAFAAIGPPPISPRAGESASLSLSLRLKLGEGFV